MATTLKKSKVDWRKLYEIKDLKIITPKVEGETKKEEAKRKEENRQIREKGFVPPPTEQTPELQYDIYRLLVGNVNKIQLQLAIEEYLMKICPVVSKSTKTDLINSRKEITKSEGINLTFDTLIEGLEKGIKPTNLKYIARFGRDRDQAPYGQYFKYDKPIPTEQEQKAIRIMVDKRYSTILRQIPPNKNIDELVSKLRTTLKTQVVNLQTAYPQLIDKHGYRDVEVIRELLKEGLTEGVENFKEKTEETLKLDKDKAIAFYKKTPELANFLKAIDENKYDEAFGEEKRIQFKEEGKKYESSEAGLIRQRHKAIDTALDIEVKRHEKARAEAKEKGIELLKPFYSKFGDKIFQPPFIYFIKEKIIDKIKFKNTGSLGNAFYYSANWQEAEIKGHLNKYGYSKYEYEVEGVRVMPEKYLGDLAIEGSFKNTDRTGVESVEEALEIEKSGEYYVKDIVLNLIYLIEKLGEQKKKYWSDRFGGYDDLNEYNDWHEINRKIVSATEENKGNFDLSVWREDSEEEQEKFFDSMLKQYGGKIFEHIKIEQFSVRVENSTSSKANFSLDFFVNTTKFPIFKIVLDGNKGQGEGGLMDWRMDRDKEYAKASGFKNTIPEVYINTATYNVEVPYDYISNGEGLLFLPPKEAIAFAKGKGRKLLDYIAKGSTEVTTYKTNVGTGTTTATHNVVIKKGAEEEAEKLGGKELQIKRAVEKSVAIEEDKKGISKRKLEEVDRRELTYFIGESELYNKDKVNLIAFVTTYVIEWWKRQKLFIDRITQRHKISSDVKKLLIKTLYGIDLSETPKLNIEERYTWAVGQARQRVVKYSPPHSITTYKGVLLYVYNAMLNSSKSYGIPYFPISTSKGAVWHNPAWKGVVNDYVGIWDDMPFLLSIGAMLYIQNEIEQKRPREQDDLGLIDDKNLIKYREEGGGLETITKSLRTSKTIKNRKPIDVVTEIVQRLPMNDYKENADFLLGGQYAFLFMGDKYRATSSGNETLRTAIERVFYYPPIPTTLAKTLTIPIPNMYPSLIPKQLQDPMILVRNNIDKFR